MSTVVETPAKVWTEAELQALPEEGFTHERVNGELVMSPKSNFEHGNVSSRLFLAMGNHVQERRLGVVLDSSTGFWMKNRNCRAPDISFVAKARLADWRPSTRKFFSGTPDLAVKILSPSNTRVEIDEQLKDFFEGGTRLAWIIDPKRQCVEVCHSPTRRKLVGCGGYVDGEDVLPGFSYAIADLFKEWDWD